MFCQLVYKTVNSHKTRYRVLMILMYNVFICAILTTAKNAILTPAKDNFARLATASKFDHLDQCLDIAIPSIRKQQVVALYGPTGSGKSIFADVIKTMFGTQNWHTSQVDELVEKSPDYQDGVNGVYAEKEFKELHGFLPVLTNLLKSACISMDQMVQQLDDKKGQIIQQLFNEIYYGTRDGYLNLLKFHPDRKDKVVCAENGRWSIKASTPQEKKQIQKQLYNVSLAKENDNALYTALGENSDIFIETTGGSRPDPDKKNHPLSWLWEPWYDWQNAFLKSDNSQEVTVVFPLVGHKKLKRSMIYRVVDKLAKRDPTARFAPYEQEQVDDAVGNARQNMLTILQDPRIHNVIVFDNTNRNSNYTYTVFHLRASSTKFKTSDPKYQEPKKFVELIQEHEELKPHAEWLREALNLISTTNARLSRRLCREQRRLQEICA